MSIKGSKKMGTSEKTLQTMNHELLTVRGVDHRVFLKMFGGKITLYCTLNVLHNLLCPAYTKLLDIVVIHCCTSCCGAVWLMLWSCSSSVQGHYPASYAGPRSRWSLNIHTLMKDVSTISTSDCGSSLLDIFSVCLVFVSGEDVSRLSHCHCDILWMCARPGRGATPFPSIIISNDQKINRNSPSYKKHGMGLHLNKWILSVSKMYMTWNGIFKMFVPP